MDQSSIQSVQPETQAQKPNNKTWLVVVAVVVGILIIGGMAWGGYYWWQNSNNQQMVGNDRDAHGCIASAGYSWCEAKQKCLRRPWEEPCDSTSATPDPTAEWQTYRNEELGFEFKYPVEFGQVNFGIRNGETGKAFYGIFSENEALVFGGIDFDFSEGRGGAFFDTQGYIKREEDYYIRFVQDREFKIERQLVKEMGAEGVQGIFIDGKEQDGPTIFPRENQKGAIINLKKPNFNGMGFFNQDINKLSVDLFDQILSTFKFVDLNSASDWQTYRNEKYGFEMKYPKDWKLSEGNYFDNFYVFFKADSYNQIGILPSGELDYGLPSQDPVVEDISIGNKNATKKEWTLSGNRFLTQIYFKEIPANWGANQRIDIQALRQYSTIIDQILSTFKFTK